MATFTSFLDILPDPNNPIEVGFFDTSSLSGLFDGNWGTYAYLPSGYIISSDRQNGLFIFESPITNSEMEWNECACGAELGDINGDESWNILDVVTLANCVLAANCQYNCQGQDTGQGFCYGCARTDEEKKIWKEEKTSIIWKKENLNLLMQRMSGWQLETFKESYSHKMKTGLSLFKESLKENKI